jgi:hypothetical protein
MDFFSILRNTQFKAERIFLIGAFLGISILSHANDVVVNLPENRTIAQCLHQDQVNKAYDDWKSEFGYNGGCDAEGAFVLLPQAPDACGGSVTVEYVVSDNCDGNTFAESYFRTFTVSTAAEVVLTVPSDYNGTACMTQQEVNTAFIYWLNAAKVKGGCNVVLTNNASAAPSACGGTIQVTWTAKSSCQADLTQTRTFAILAAPSITLSVPDNYNGTNCMTQEEVNNAFTHWLNDAIVTGGCKVVLTNNGNNAPSACGGSIQVTWTAKSNCYAELTRTRTFTIPVSPQVSVTGPANIVYSGCEFEGSADLNMVFSDWKAQFSLTESGCGGQVPDHSNKVAPSLCGGGVTTINYTFTDGCKSATHTATFTVSPCYMTVKNGIWSDISVWKNGCRPSTAQGLPNYAKIYIDHDLMLDGDFKPVQGTNFLDVYVRNGASWHITGELHSLRNLSIYIKESSGIQIGNEPPECYTDFCENVPIGCSYKKSLFRVDGSAQGGSDDPPGVYISEGGNFHLYGDLVVNQNYDIVVAPGGQFIVEGSFTAGNNAEVGFYGEENSGSYGYIGCDMNFLNSGKIYMVGAVIDVGGALWFGNAGDIYLSGSTLNVWKDICSGSGSGQGAVITIHHGYWDEYGNYHSADEDDESFVNAGEFCAQVQNPDNVPLPIELLSFKSEVFVDHVILHWVTAAEINNNYFNIERSIDLKEWSVIGQVAGTGTTNHIRKYQFVDMTPVKGLSYYRLKQTDFDGLFEYFAPVSVIFTEQMTEMEIKIIKTAYFWQVVLPGENEFLVEVYNLTGNMISSQNAMYNLNIPLMRHPIIIRVISNSQQSVSKVVM